VTHVVDLSTATLAWRELTMPGSTPPVRTAQLCSSPTGASTFAVRFPAGWRRPGTGHYLVAEQFVVLDGTLEVSGVRYAAGDAGHLPAAADRTDSGSDHGCLAVAWFEGPPRWIAAAGAGAVAGGGHAIVADVLAGTELGGGATVVADPATLVPHAPAELLWVAARTWCVVLPGEPVPPLPGPAVVRIWQDGVTALRA
jgi:hypothetical protein